MKLRLTGIKHTNIMKNASCARCAVILHFIHHIVLPETFTTDTHPHTFLYHHHPCCFTPLYKPHPCLWACMPPCLLWSSQQTSSPTEKDTNHKLSSLSPAGCGAKWMRCRVLLKQELLLMYWSVHEEQSRHGKQQARIRAIIEENRES